MRAQTLRMKTARTQSIAYSLPAWRQISPKKMFIILALSFILVFILYVYLVNSTVKQVVARENNVTKASALSTAVADLEFNYINLTKNITLDLAYSKGFTDATPSQFLKADGTQALTFNTSR